MKLVSWGIIFVIIIFSFSFSIRVILDNKMEIMKKEIEYNNALNEATLDATKELATNMEYEYSTKYEDPRMILNSMNRFFETFGLSFGYYGGNAKNSQVRMYVPAILTMSYNGFYIYHMENIENHYLEHTLTPKQYYATQSGGLNINFTLDNYVRVSQNVSLEGIYKDTYSNAYGLGDTFSKLYLSIPYTDANIRNIGDVNLSGNVTGSTAAYDAGYTVPLPLDDLYLMNQMAQNFANWDTIDRTLLSNPQYNHTDLSQYTTYWYYDLNQDGFIDYYDTLILYDYLKFKSSSDKWQSTNEGRIVDLRHYNEIISNNGLVSVTNGSGVTYEKSFYNSGGIRYLLEEWYTAHPDVPNQNKYLYRRMTPYTEEDYAFTLAISNIPGVESYLYHGKPENTGFVNPFTGQYEIGEFNARKKELITQQVTEQLEYYVMKHNQYAGAYGITYDFTLPELSDTDWTNALSDITVIAFVQGIPILGQQYYNNYGLAGSNIIDKEFFIGYDNGITPIYYSSRILDKTNAEFVKRLSSVDIFDYSREAAINGYYPDIDKDPSVLENLIEDNVMITYEDIGSTATQYKWRIRGGTFIDEILYIHDNTGGYNKRSFYNNSDAVQKVNPIHINQYYNGTEYVTEVTIPKNVYGRTLILIRDVDGRTRYIENGTLLSAPTFAVTYNESTNKFILNATNLKYGLSYGGRIEHWYGGSLIDTIYVSTENYSKSNYSIGAFNEGQHQFKLIRNGDNYEIPILVNVTLYDDPTISVTYDKSTYKFTVTVDNLQYAGGTGGTLEYYYNGHTRTYIMTNNSETLYIDSLIVSGTNNGDHIFTIKRDDYPTVSTAIDQKKVNVFDGIIITGVSYDADTNLITVTVTGINGRPATLEYQAKNKNGTNITAVGGAGLVSTGVTASGVTTFTFSPRFVPAKYDITVNCTTAGGTTLQDKYNDFEPLPEIHMYMMRRWDGIVNSRYVYAESTYIGSTATISNNYFSGLDIKEQTLTGTNNLSCRYNYNSTSDRNKNITITISINGYNIRCQYTMTNSIGWEDVGVPFNQDNNLIITY